MDDRDCRRLARAGQEPTRPRLDCKPGPASWCRRGDWAILRARVRHSGPKGRHDMSDPRWTVAIPAILALLLASAAQASSTGRCGGNGPNSTSITCARGQYVVGISARGDSYVDQIGIRCASFDKAGKRIGSGSWKTVGPGGGDNSRDKTCASTRAVTDVAVRSGIYLDRVLSASCRKRVAGGFDETPAASTNLDIDIGGLLGGSFCELECPGGEALYGVTVTHGSWIDSITGKCRP